MQRDMWKIAKSMEQKIPGAYDLRYKECIQLNEKWSSGEPNARFDAILTAFGMVLRWLNGWRQIRGREV